MILTTPVYDYQNLSCILSINNNSYQVNMTMQNAGNYKYFKCSVPQQPLGEISAVSIAVVYLGEFIPL